MWPIWDGPERLPEDEQGDDWYPPKVEYPEGHSPMCYRECEHLCHIPYDEWRLRQDAWR